MAKGFNKTQLKIVNSRLQALANLPDTEVPKILKKVSEEIQKDVIAKAPISQDSVSRGNLRRSVYQSSSDDRAKVWVDTTLTETRKSSRNFNYGHTVEHGRAGQYKTTPYFYDVAMRSLGKLVTFINNAVRDAAIKGK
jgi:hypothetical protein